MEKYLEDCENPIIQVFAEFVTFLYVTQNDCKTNLMLHNIMLESKKIHSRTLCDFFANNRRTADDYIYKDFITTTKDLSVEMSPKLRKFINKSLAHISKKRGTKNIEFSEEEFRQIEMGLIKSIKGFMGELDKNINTRYKKD